MVPSTTRPQSRTRQTSTLDHDQDDSELDQDPLVPDARRQPDANSSRAGIIPRLVECNHHGLIVTTDNIAGTGQRKRVVRRNCEEPLPPTEDQKKLLNDPDQPKIPRPDGERDNNGQLKRPSVPLICQTFQLKYSEYKSARATARHVAEAHELEQKGRIAAKASARKKRRTWVDRPVTWRDVPGGAQTLAAQAVDKEHRKVGRAADSWLSRLMLMTYFQQRARPDSDEDDADEIETPIAPSASASQSNRTSQSQQARVGGSQSQTSRSASFNTPRQALVGTSNTGNASVSEHQTRFLQVYADLLAVATERRPVSDPDATRHYRQQEAWQEEQGNFTDGDRPLGSQGEDVDSVTALATGRRSHGEATEVVHARPWTR